MLVVSISVQIPNAIIKLHTVNLVPISNIPPSYKHIVWDYKKANTVIIKKLIELVNWKTLFNKKLSKNKSLSLAKL